LGRGAAPDRLLALSGDAAAYVDVSAAVEATLRRFGRLDVAAANAGYTTFDDVADGDPHGWHHMVLTNVLGPALLIRAALPALRETRGRIILVGRVAGVVYSPGNIYGATK
jgi:NAD(P)-dependent dehydrogenase (short-subunit alcohol dehydrogenase family)